MNRDIHPIPEEVKCAMQEHGVVAAYRLRPPYQQNDYIGWIIQAKRETTRRKRLQQMIEELKNGTHYMKMKWKNDEAT